MKERTTIERVAWKAALINNEPLETHPAKRQKSFSDEKPARAECGESARTQRLARLCLGSE